METNCFDVHVSNLSISISKTHLSKLFSQAGDVLSVQTQPAFTNAKYTYAFVRFSKLEDAKNACALFSNKNIDGLVIKVNLSIKTQQRLNTKSPVPRRSHKIYDASIIRKSMPRVEPGTRHMISGSKEKQLQQILKRNLHCLNDFNNTNTKWLGIKSQEDTEDFMRSFKNALTDMAKMPQSVGCDVIKHKGEKVDTKTLESIIIRYHQPFKKHNLFKEVDFDLSNKMTLNKEENKDYFRLLATSSMSNSQVTSHDDTVTRDISICTYDDFCKLKIKE